MNVKLIAHRGFRIGFVENTLSGFRKAVELKVDYIELDVHLSQDGVIYVLHDETLDRTMNGHGLIREHTSEQLDEIVTHSRRNPLPRLSTVCEQVFLPENKVTNLMIELKGENTAQAVCDYLKPKDFKDRVVFSGRNLVELKIAHQLLPDVPICLNITKSPEFTLDNLYQIQNKNELPLPFNMISLKSTMISNSQFVEACHKWDIQALTWDFMVHSLENLVKMQEFIDTGMDGFLLDDPKSVEALQQYLALD